MQLTLFKNNEFGAVRVLRDENNEPWFVAKDVCDVLGIQNSRRAVKEMVDEDDVRKTYITDNLGRNQEAIIINESGLYSLILRSNKPQAKKFKKWVTSEVLPAIRKYGIYATDEIIEKTINNPDFLIEILSQLKKERQEKEKLKEKVTILTHTKKLYTSTEIAKELGFKSAKAFNKKLQELGIQYKVNNTWVLTAKYADLGYESIKQHILDDGRVIYDRKWTQLGREFLLNLFKGAINETPHASNF